MKKLIFCLMAAVAFFTTCNDDNDDNEKVIVVTGVSLDQSELKASPGLKKILEAIITPENATNKSVRWSSNNPAVAINDSTGEMQALTLTSDIVTITVRTIDGGFTASRTLTVVNVPVTGIKLDVEEVLVFPESPITMVAQVLSGAAANKNVIWSSDNPTVASINATTGVLTGLSAGYATITVTTEEGGFTASCLAKVLSANLLKNPGFEEPDDGTMVMGVVPQGWESVPRDWFESYYEAPGIGINVPNRVYRSDAFFITGVGSFFVNTMKGNYACRVMVGNTSGLFQIANVTPGKKYLVSADVGYWRNNMNNNSIKVGETLKILSPDGLTTHFEVVIVTNPSVQGNVLTDIYGEFVAPQGVTQVRFQLENRNYDIPNQAPLMLVDSCELRELPDE